MSTLFKRKAYDKLLRWKRESNGSSAMLIEGARRVGKSTLVQAFGRREYAAYLLLDFSQVAQEVKELFHTQRGDLNTFFRYLSAYYPEFKPVLRNTLIIFDEVQLFPEARQFIKQLVADGRYDYVETGSLISIRRNVQDILLPSEEDAMDLEPLDFEEFLWALGEDALASLIRESYEQLDPLPDALHHKAERLFREYMLVGGMPQALETYLDANNFQAVDVAKRRILRLYCNDIAKYAEGDEKRIGAIFDAIPSQLAKHEKRFTLASLGSGARYDAYESAFFWLADARLTNMCVKSNDPNVGLGLNLEQSAFKCYMADTGLLVSHAFADNSSTSDEVYRSILANRLHVNEGMIVENVVAQELKAHGHKLHYYSHYDTDAHKSDVEVDFLLVRPFVDAVGKDRVSPIEVKSAQRYRGTPSLDKFRTMFGKRVGTEYVLHPKPLKCEGNRIYLPLYMAGLL